MCVIVAKKVKLKSSKESSTPKESWFLAKIRDRSYSPIYSLDVQNKNSVQSLFLTDQRTAWSEGVSDNGMMIVSAALDNHSDLEDGGPTRNTPKPHTQYTPEQKKKTQAIRDAISASSVKDAVKILTDKRFVGTSFISDGTDLTILEIFVKDEAWQREIDKHGEKKLEKMEKADQRALIQSGITPDDYNIEEQPIKKDKLVVRTNHGRLIKDAGYTPTDEELQGWNSSKSRYEIANKALKGLSDDSHPFDILTTLKNLKGCSKDPQMCPVRISDDNPDNKFWSSTIVLLTPTGTLFAIPLDSEMVPDASLRLKKGRTVDFVMLPKALPLFESIVYKNTYF